MQQLIQEHDFAVGVAVLLAILLCFSILITIIVPCFFDQLFSDNLRRGTLDWANHATGMVTILPPGKTAWDDTLKITNGLAVPGVAQLSLPQEVWFTFEPVPPGNRFLFGTSTHIRPVPRLRLFFETIARAWCNYRTLRKQAAESRRKVWESKQKALLEKERMEWERAVAEEHRRAHDPAEIEKRRRLAKIQAIEIEFDSFKPKPPPAKSERLTETERVKRETSWFGDATFACLMVFIPVSIFAAPLLQAMGGFFIFLVLVVFGGILIGYRINFESEGNKRRLSAQRYDEDKQWAEEDAVWRQYEVNVAAWEREKRQRLFALDALKTDSDGVTNIGRKIIDELNL